MIVKIQAPDALSAIIKDSKEKLCSQVEEAAKKYVTMLVELGADVDYETKTGLTPMICCAMKGNFKCAEAVLLDPWSRPLANPFRKNRFGEDARGRSIRRQGARLNHGLLFPPSFHEI